MKKRAFTLIEWKDPRTIEAGRLELENNWSSAVKNQPDNEDLTRVRKAFWERLRGSNKIVAKILTVCRISEPLSDLWNDRRVKVQACHSLFIDRRNDFITSNDDVFHD
ncbi:hypothetical protein ACFL3F_00730 [Planctomycetota bacterium]